jgi:hypothetical protein
MIFVAEKGLTESQYFYIVVHRTLDGALILDIAEDIKRQIFKTIGFTSIFNLELLLISLLGKDTKGIWWIPWHTSR